MIMERLNLNWILFFSFMVKIFLFMNSFALNHIKKLVFIKNFGFWACFVTILLKKTGNVKSYSPL